MSTTFRWFVTATAITEISSAALRPDDRAAEDDPGGRIGEDLHEPARVAVDQRLRVGRERHLRDAELATRRERLRFGDADLRDLGIGEDRLRGLVVVEMPVRPRGQPHDVLRDLAALHRRDRRQRQPARHVAGGVDVRQIGLAVTVAGDVAVVVDLDPRRLAPEALAVGERTDAEQRVRSVDRASVVARDEHLVGVAAHRDGARALQQLHTPPQELVLERGRDLGVLVGQHLLARHDQRDLRARAR